MTSLILGAWLLAQAGPVAAGAEPELRTVWISVTDERGAALPGLTDKDVVVIESGVARDVSRIERDQRPLVAAILVDSSADLQADYRLNLVEAVAALVEALPRGARYTLWKTGDRPTRLVELTEDRSAAGKALRRTFPDGGNTLFDALVEATRDLKQEEGALSAVIVLTGYSIDFSNRTRFRALDEARGNADLFAAVVIDEGSAPFESRAAYDYVLRTLTSETGGYYDLSLSAMSAGRSLRALAADLEGRYRLTYLTDPGLKERRLEVQVARPGAKVRVAAGRQAKDR